MLLFLFKSQSSTQLPDLANNSGYKVEVQIKKKTNNFLVSVHPMQYLGAYLY